MTFKDWLFSNRPEGFELKSEPWGMLHIAVLLAVIFVIVLASVLLKNSSKKSKYYVLVIIAVVIAFFEIARRIINFTKGTFISDDNVVDIRGIIQVLIPRPWCAISCWVIVASIFVKKKFFYNFAAITALLNAVIFFSYPAAGFKNHIAFEEVYSIITHCMLLTGSILLITLGFTDFRYKREKDSVLSELIAIVVVFVYAGLEILFKIEGDPLYFMPGNDILDILGLPYIVYLILYFVFVFGIWCNSFYLINNLSIKNKINSLKRSL